MAEIITPRRFVVGYALAPKKQQSFIQPSLVDLARERGIDLVAIDASRRLADQGLFDCVIHKLYGEDWKAQLEDFAARNPSVPIVDPPLAIERLHNRISMLQVVSELEIPQVRETIGIPSQVVIYDSGALSNSGVVGALHFPVIAKPLVADGSAKSHKMSLVFHRDALLKLKPPLVLQEFVNHGGVIFKVDVKIGNRYLVIDINYFPGYAKMPSYEKILTDFFWNIVYENKEQDPGGLAVGDSDKESMVLVGNHRKMAEDMENVG
ncbi:hypothetical protein C4D60_Mb07t21910 [Musa balbisiana]|uniref:Inositol-tetrakisphosphate 1-kinase n=1 Tax=Musa balbisiana TaxID=52838 RepID=A0A4S8JH30_MUSBA|nr:hypothetical protein C4D60_Mb07t21910 [Musa balbisiana]